MEGGFMGGRLAAPLVLALCTSLCGCIGTNHGRPEQTGARSVQAHERLDVAEPIHWRQIVLDDPPKARLRGYVKSEIVAGNEFHEIYDRRFTLLGWVEGYGETFRLDSRGEPRALGPHNLERSILLIFRRDIHDSIRLTRMPDPL